MNAGDSVDSDEATLGGWLLRRASWPLVAAAVALLVAGVFECYRRGDANGLDNAFVAQAARRWLDGGSPYADKRFLYLPGAVIAAVPMALMPDGALRLAVPAAVVGLVLGGWYCSLRLFGIPPRSRLAVAVAGGLVFFAPFRSLAVLGNWTAMSALALPLALLLVLRSRWTAAAVVVGVAIALKPMLVPFALLFVFARRWRALAVAAAVPGAVSVLAALVMPNPTFFFSRTLPFLLHGQDHFAGPFDASLVAVLPRLGVPQAVALAVAVVAAAGGAGCAWLRWRRGVSGEPGEEALRLVDTGTMLMLAAFLVSRPSFDHYVLVVLPPLLASVVMPGSAPRSPWFWVALVPQVPVVNWPYLLPITRRAFKDAVMLGGLAAVVASRCIQARTVPWPRRAGWPPAQLPRAARTRPFAEVPDDRRAPGRAVF